MRIAHVGRFKKDSTNGVFQCIYNIAVNEAKIGHTVFVYTFDSVAKVELEIIEGVNIVRFPSLDIPGLKRFKGFFVPRELKKRLLKNTDKIDILHLHSVYTPYNTIISGIAKKSGINYVLTPHGGYSTNCSNRSMTTKLKKYVYDVLFEKKMIENAAMIHCVSQREKDDSVINHSNIIVVNNGVNIPKKRNNCSKNETINILFLGRIDIVHKGLDILLEGFWLYKKKRPDTRIRIIIAGPSMGNDEKILKDYVVEKNLESNVEFMGKVLREKKDELFEQKANLFVHTSRWEGLPISVLEALSYGLPVLISKETNIGKYVREYNAGWVLEELTPDAVAESLFEVEKNDFTCKAQNARELAESTFSWDVLVPKLVENYKTSLLK